MAYKRIDDAYIRGCMKEYICDTDADFENLPDACVGSTAVSIESGKVMVVSTFGNWIPFGEGYVEKEPLASVVGTWVFNDEITIPTNLDCTIDFSVEKDNEVVEYDRLKHTTSLGPPVAGLQYLSGNATAGVYSLETNYGFNSGWVDEGYQTITVTEETENEVFVTWLYENATKVG